MLPIAVDAMGGDKAPGRDRRRRPPGRRRARHPRRARRARRRPARLRRPAAHRRRPRSSPWTRTRPGRPPQEGLVARAGRRGGARRQGRRPWCRPATPAPRWRRRCCAWAASRASAGPPSPPPIPVPRQPRRPSCSTPAPTPSASPSGWCSSPRWARSSPATASASTEPRVGLLSIGEEPGKGNSLVKETYALLATGARRRLHRQRRGPRPHDRRRRRRRHRRLHRQRRAQDPRGRAAGSIMAACSTRVRRPRPTPAAHVEPLLPALDAALRDARPRHLRRGRCCSASTASASSATARRRPTAIVNAIKVAREMVDDGRRGASSAPRSPPADRQDGRDRRRYALGRPAPSEQEAVSARRDPRRAGSPSTATRSSSSSATAWPTSSRSSPRSISEGQSFADDLDADSLALIELVEALEEELGERTRRLPHRRRGPRGPEDACATPSTTSTHASRRADTDDARSDAARRGGSATSFQRPGPAAPGARPPLVVRREPGPALERAARVPRRRRARLGRGRPRLPPATPTCPRAS